MLTDTGIEQRYLELLAETLDIPASLYGARGPAPPFAWGLAVSRRLEAEAVQSTRVATGFISPRHSGAPARRRRRV